MAKVFIDGSVGTTGLRIYERLSDRSDLQLLTLPEELRKDLSARKEMALASDITFLCLPDDASREIVAALGKGGPAVIDTSTAHRTDLAWTYGFPELGNLREKIAHSDRVANPGCHASGFLALVQPLVANGLIAADEKLTCFSITGYSGGGKKMIAEYESEERSSLLASPRQYALSQTHKHLKEMTVLSGLQNTPIFCPIVSDYYAGMEVTVPLFTSQCRGSLQDVADLYQLCYRGPIVRYRTPDSEGGFLAAGAYEGRDDMEVTVAGNDERMLLIARFDNLGKGASGAAVQNMNLLLSVPETTGLNLSN